MVSESRDREPGEEVAVLDHGYVKLIEIWGSDERIIEAARMSTDKGFEGWGGLPCTACRDAGRLDAQDGLFKSYEMQKEAKKDCVICKGTGKTIGDERLLAYLWNNKHHTPFEMGGMTLEIQAPIFVFREWHRHRTQSYNELSARYTPLPDVNYMPTLERVLMKSEKNKQAQGLHGIQSEPGNAQAWLYDLETFYQNVEHLYQMGLKMGLPKEIARVCIPVGRYSRMRASANLRNWLGFLTLRMSEAAQLEIRLYAEVVADLCRAHFPRTMNLFDAR